MQLPARVPVTGTDWFLLAFERAMRTGVGAAGVCHLLLELDGPLDEAVVEAATADPVWRWLRTIRLERRPGRLPSWVARGEGDPGVTFHRVDDLAEVTGLFRHRGLDDGALVHLDVARDGTGRTAVVLSWHHALMDARGAETLMRRLAGGPSVADAVVALDPEAGPTGTALERLLLAREARDRLFDVSAGSVGTVVPPPAPGTGLVHRVWTFDEAETVRLDARAVEVGAHVVRSALVLGAVARAVRALRRHRGEPVRQLLVPVPQDQRKRGAVGPILGNQLGMLFYRLADDDLGTLPGTVAALTAQLREQMRAGWPEAYAALLGWCRWLPLGLLWQVVSGPTGGAVASFGFSDTGDSLGRISAFRGAAVARAVHYPANLHPPGFTVITSRVRGRTVLCASWFEGALTAEEEALMENSLRADLLGQG